ncbi:hypothetical protein B0F90DRAFT_1815568 [Multifurca ochricompacta]|uniref:Uncharacterized protein n=1 Tax=Multifurca ochricompacta TaxID=376703 RepID=A0AAD4QQG6_9AGAM|nr:hypothetical protein B0F90DRAFT_1815568 [Multifurca ochricompacta]
MYTGIAVAWEAQALFDALIFALTVGRTLRLRKLHSVATSFTGMGLLDIFLRDVSKARSILREFGFMEKGLPSDGIATASA